MTEVNSVTENLLKIKLGDGFEFKKLDEWVYPDKFKFHKNIYIFSDFIVLYKNNLPIAQISYSVFPGEYIGNKKKSIRINFLQGVLQKENGDKGINFRTLKKSWHEIIMEAFIFSCNDLLKKDFKINYKGVRDLQLIKENILTNKKHIEKFKLKIETIEKKIKRINLLKRKYKNNELKLNQLNKIEYKLKLNLDFAKSDLKKAYRYSIKFKSEAKSIGTIRDLYFKKDGYLNIDKERVKRILNNISKYRENKRKITIIKNKILKEKRIIKIKRK